MSYITSIILLLSFPLFAFAQTSPDGNELNSHFLLNPEFQVGKIQINQNVAISDTISGTVDVRNNNDASFGNIRMQILLLEPAPLVTKPNTIIADTARVIDRVILPETNSFSPKEQKSLPFAYNVPKIPEGNYRIRLQIITSNGNEYGWNDLPVSLGVKDISFLMLSPQPIVVRGEEYHPEEGVNVQPREDFILPLAGTFSGDTPVLATPILTTYAFDLTGSVVDTQTGTPVPLTPGKDFSGELAVTSTQKSGSYLSTLVFIDSEGNRISNLEQYRWVVTGVTGRIISGQFTSLTETEAVATFEVVGPADRETSVDARVVVSLLDGAGVRHEEVAHFVDLGPSGARTATATFSLKTTLQDPGLRVVLTDVATSTELDRYTMHVPPLVHIAEATSLNSSEKQESKAPYSRTFGIVFLTLLLFLLAIGLCVVRQHGKQLPHKGLLLIVMAGASLFGVVMYNSQTINAANGIVIDAVGNAITSITINSPLHDNNLVANPLDPTAIPVSFVMKYIHCNNKQNLSFLSIYNLREGGKPALAGYFDWPILVNPNESFFHIISPNTINWDPYANMKNNATNGSFDRLVAQDFPNNDCRGGRNRECVRTINFIGSLSVSPNLQSTTLLWLSYTRRQIAGSGLNADARYTWLNFAASPQTPTVNLKINGSDAPPSVAVNSQAAVSWTSANVDSCIASNSWSGLKATYGLQYSQLPLLKKYTFTITCSGGLGTATDTVSITTSPGLINNPNPIPRSDGTFEESR